MTINKCQGQTLNNVALHLEEDVFSHGQLYVALSRVKSIKSINVFTNNGNYVKNVVYKQVFQT